MVHSRELKRLTVCSLTTMMCMANVDAFAHTGVRDTVTASSESATTSNNAFTIPHGCSAGEGDAPPKKVKGQSAVFPFGPPAAQLTGPGAVWVRLGQAPTPPTLLTAEEVTAIIGDADEDPNTPPHLNLDVTGVQDASLFKTQTEEVNPAGTDPLGPHDSIPVRALNWLDGKLETNLLGITQFRVTVPTIVNPCVSRVRIRIAVSNWCERNQNEASDPDNNRADWWFTGETGPKNFVDPDLIQESFWTTLTVNNPNASESECGGEPHEVAVMPSGADIDQYLPLEGFTADPAPF
jgi:hypothetical protein